MEDALKPVPDDGLLAPAVGEWSQEKHRLLALYATMFSKAMQGKWESLVYLDLFAGAGRCRIEHTSHFMLTSATLVLALPVHFDRYVFGDSDPETIRALRKRVHRDFPERERDVVILEGDCNTRVDDFLAQVTARSLALCFVDPFSLSNLKFETIKRLANRKVDFFVLIPSSMDANRNERHYVQAHNRTLDEFLGNGEWRDRWRQAKPRNETFERFVVEEFGRSMTAIEYLAHGPEAAPMVRSAERNLPLYRLVLYSRNQLGSKFWQEAQKYSTRQMKLDL